MKTIIEYLSTKVDAEKIIDDEKINTKEHYNDPPYSYLKAQLLLRGERTVDHDDIIYEYEKCNDKDKKTLEHIIGGMKDDELICLYVNIVETSKLTALKDFVESVANSRGYTMEKIKHH